MKRMHSISIPSPPPISITNGQHWGQTHQPLRWVAQVIIQLLRYV